ncbi:Immunoglobulin heavy variable 1-45 [Anabarilius grahami]|nr:Immunoglobulin heavy variable 1-45 [Anabarilius grahami]
MDTCFILILIVGTGETFAQSITPQQENKVLKSAGDEVTLSCKYDGAVNNLHWYRQYPGSKPEFLAYIYPHGLKSEPLPPRLLPKVDKNNNLVYLEISSAEVSDSALYYCALTPTVTGNTSSLYKNILNNKSPHKLKF